MSILGRAHDIVNKEWDKSRICLGCPFRSWTTRSDTGKTNSCVDKKDSCFFYKIHLDDRGED